MTYLNEPQGKAKRKPLTVESDGSPDLFSLPVTPYKGKPVDTAGFSGTKTSEERALNDVHSGELSKRQAQVIHLLEERKEKGLTWLDLSQKTGWHHGASSGVLSVLHKAGAIVRIDEVRERSLVYVLPQYIDGRPISPIITIACACGYSLKPSYWYCPMCGTRKQEA